MLYFITDHIVRPNKMSETCYYLPQNNLNQRLLKAPTVLKNLLEISFQFFVSVLMTIL